ncbi:MAG: hypothetical protein ACJA01_002515 [Saprospiraceae bacterium]|jgi:hypothetical protein
MLNWILPGFIKKNQSPTEVYIILLLNQKKVKPP